ncbi:MAG: TrgA family protein [Rhodobacteraceae bacterium]|nr:TrgA family protein [Paracoccaceae bacterium]
MPTAAKLVAAICLAVLGFAGASLFYTFLPEGTRATYFAPVSAGLGAVTGWRVLGGGVGRGLGPATGTGLRAAITLFVLALVVFSIREMLIRATRRHFGGLVDALTGTFDSIRDYALLSLDPRFWALMLLGGALAGLLAELANRRWR